MSTDSAGSAGCGFSAYDCDVSSNTATGGGGAVAAFGASTVTITSSSVSNNSAGSGGVVGFYQGAVALSTVRLENLTVRNNSAIAGTLYAAVDSATAFGEPVCLNCNVTLGGASGYVFSLVIGSRSSPQIPQTLFLFLIT